MRRKVMLTQLDVAQALGRSKEWIRMMEQGKAPCRELQEYWGE